MLSAGDGAEVGGVCNIFQVLTVYFTYVTSFGSHSAAIWEMRKQSPQPGDLYSGPLDSKVPVHLPYSTV